jgi:hypothetical protein
VAPATFNQLRIITDVPNPWGADQFIALDYLTLSDEGEAVTAQSLWNDWLAIYPGVGTSTNLTDNPDGDVLDNLAEYAMGGNPDNAGNIGNATTTTTIQESGTNYLQYVYQERADATLRGLDYFLEQQSTDLTSDNWTNDNYEVVDVAYGSNWNSVTNRIPTDSDAMQFLRLRIEAQ